MKFLFTILFIFLFSLHAKVINFSPLPMDKAPKLFIQYTPMLEYLEKETGMKFKFNYSSNYDEIIEKFKKGELDIIELGPLPFVKLKDKYTDANAFLTFLTKNGEDSYTCEFLTTDKNIKTLNDINTDINIKLTRKISTCGYLMSEFMLRENGKSLERLNYEYIGIHSNVLLALLLEDKTAGSAKSTIVNKYKHFDFHTLKSSPPIPGFAFVANMKTISNKQIEKIQEALLKLKPLENKKDKNFVLNWSENTKYGCVKTQKDSYKDIFKALETIAIPKEDKK